MGYSKNKINVVEGLGGYSSPSNAMAVIGIAEKTYNDIIAISNLNEIEEKLGEGELRDFLTDAFSFDSTPVAYVMSIAGSISGTISSVTENKTGDGSISVSGNPRNRYNIVVEILSDGGLNEATFKVVSDNRTIVTKATIPANGIYQLGNTGLTLTFTAGTNGFKMFDTFSFYTTAPKAANEEVLEALEKVLDSKKKYRFIAIPIETQKALWSAIDTRLEMETDKNKFTRCITMCRDVANNETLDQYVNAMTTTERGTIQCKRVAVVLSRAKIVDAKYGNEDVRSVIGKYCGWLLRNKIQESPAKTMLGSISGILDFAYYNNKKFSEGHLKDIDKSGFVTIRDYYEKDGVYFTSGRMLVDETSDFAEIMNCFVMDKACSVVAERLFVYLNKDETVGVDGTLPGISYLKAWGQQPLDDMRDIYNEISQGYFIVPDNQNILQTKELIYYVDIIPKGYITSLRGTIKFINPLNQIGGE